MGCSACGQKNRPVTVANKPKLQGPVVRRYGYIRSTKVSVPSSINKPSSTPEPEAQNVQETSDEGNE